MLPNSETAQFPLIKKLQTIACLKLEPDVKKPVILP